MTALTLTTDATRARLTTTTSALRPMTLSCDASRARVALVPETALLLAGDAVCIDVHVKAGAHLEIVETSGTVAYNMRGGCASWQVNAIIESGASLTWKALPFVAAAGAIVDRSTIVSLAEDAQLLLRETLVLGRVGEEPGRMRSRLDTNVLVEELDSAVLPCRVLDQVLAVGYCVEPGAMALESGDQLYRWMGEEAHSSPLERLGLKALSTRSR